MSLAALTECGQAYLRLSRLLITLSSNSRCGGWCLGNFKGVGTFLWLFSKIAQTNCHLCIQEIVRQIGRLCVFLYSSMMEVKVKDHSSILPFIYFSLYLNALNEGSYNFKRKKNTEFISKKCRGGGFSQIFSQFLYKHFCIKRSIRIIFL